MTSAGTMSIGRAATFLDIPAWAFDQLVVNGCLSLNNFGGSVSFQISEIQSFADNWVSARARCAS
jgi:hypothetical protein